MSTFESDPQRASDANDTADSPDSPDSTNSTETTDLSDATDVGSTADASTPALETTAMSDDETRNSEQSQQFSDPTADPAPAPAADPSSDPVGSVGTTSLSSHLGWPETPTSAPAASTGSGTARPPAASDWTSPIPTTETREVPAARPFRVEPATPVPDDVVAGADPAPGSSLPHLPPPSAPAPAAQAPGGSTRPALVVVRRGPRPGAIMLGLLSMIVAGYILAANLTDTDLSFRLVGPPMIGAFGGMLLIVGLIGVLAGRMRR